MHTCYTPQTRGIVLAGDHRWGNSAMERLLPRPLLPVADSPMICYALRWLRDAGIHATTICANSRSHLVRQVLGDGGAFRLDLNYFDDLTPRGPAGCVRDAGLAWPAEELVVVEGTIIPTLDVLGLLAAHRDSGAALTVVTVRDRQRQRPGGLWTAPVGVYVFSPRALEAVPATGYQDIKEMLIPKLHTQGLGAHTFEIQTDCPRITSFESYMEANAAILRRFATRAVTLPGYRPVGEAVVHETARIGATARLAGPVLIGPDTEVANDAALIGPTVLGRGCRVARGAIVSHTVAWDECSVAEAALVDRCVLTSGATIDARAIQRHHVHLAQESSAEPATTARPERRRWWHGTGPRPVVAAGGTPAAAKTQPARPMAEA